MDSNIAPFFVSPAAKVNTIYQRTNAWVELFRAEFLISYQILKVTHPSATAKVTSLKPFRFGEERGSMICRSDVVPCFVSYAAKVDATEIRERTPRWNDSMWNF